LRAQRLELLAVIHLFERAPAEHLGDALHRRADPRRLVRIGAAVQLRTHDRRSAGEISRLERECLRDPVAEELLERARRH
jgi:hypothetical protein